MRAGTETGTGTGPGVGAGSAGRRGRPTTVPTKVAAIAVGVPEATIRQWARRGRLTRYGTPGRAEYDIEELTSIAEERTA